MGTAYKGNTKYYRSIGQNVMIVANKYHYENGRFGVNSKSTGNQTRNIFAGDPLSTAKDFYDKLALGGIEKSIHKNGVEIHFTKMADGTIVTMRKTSTSDGTPVVEINISGSNHTGGIQKQKIHFVKGDFNE